MNEDLQRKPITSSSGIRRYLIYADVLLVVFLLGLIPMWLKGRTAANSLDETEHQLVLCKTQSDLASADRLSDLFVAYRKIMNG